MPLATLVNVIFMDDGVELLLADLPLTFDPEVVEEEEVEAACLALVRAERKEAGLEA